MPEIYSQYHDTFLENYLGSNESKILSKDRILFALNVSKYIFPVLLNVKVLIFFFFLNFLNEYSQHNLLFKASNFSEHSKPLKM